MSFINYYMDFFFGNFSKFLFLIFFKDFIYLFDRERQQVREGTQAGGVGEEEAGS